jgi:hypothetical protein
LVRFRTRTLFGSLYASTNKVRVLNLTNALVTLSNGNLPQSSLTNEALLTNSFLVTGTNSLSLKVAPTSGSFTGSMLVPGTRKKLAFKGVVLQSRNLAIGSFQGTNQTGTLLLTPAH